MKYNLSCKVNDCIINKIEKTFVGQKLNLRRNIYNVQVDRRLFYLEVTFILIFCVGKFNFGKKEYHNICDVSICNSLKKIFQRIL